MLYFRLLYDFQAADANELTCKTGDIVRAEKFVDQDGWLMVELANDPSRRGFVPIGYVAEASPSDALALAASNESRRARSGERASFTGAALKFGSTFRDNLNEQAVINETKAAASRHGATGDATESAMVLKPTSALPNPSAVVETFLKNEAHYKQLVAKRHEAMQNIKASIADASKKLTECKEKNIQLARRLGDLESTMQKERQKWRQRVDEERQLLAQKSSAPLFVSMAAPAHSGLGGSVPPPARFAD